MPVLDLFAGPGGWDLAATELGLDPLGIEIDEAACATRAAAGLRSVQGDVAALDPKDFAPCELLIASPPCQAWSIAGKKSGTQDQEPVVECLRELAKGQDTRATHRAACIDDRSLLVVEPLRWTLALRPSYIALEQVPPVLPLWELVAGLLEDFGYQCWTGVLEAERYGVPQTRERAILMGSVERRQMQPPAPTHQRYVPGESQRHDITIDGECLPWVSMAEALGWEGAVRTANFTAKNYRGERGRLYERTAEAPSPTVCGQTDQWENVNVPAPTVTAGGTESGGPEVFGRGGRDRINRSRRDQWVTERPATTVACDSRIAPAGHHDNHMNGAIRVSREEAAILQTFPLRYPWQGSRSKQFEQIGNAVPPLLASAILTALLGDEEANRVAA